MVDLLKYFTEDRGTYAAQGIVLYNFDESKSAEFIHEMMVPIRDMFVSEEKILREMTNYKESRTNIISEHLPTKHSIMSGDFGEALTHYFALNFFAKNANVAPKKLRFKGDPDSPLPKTDVMLFYIENENTPSNNDTMYSIEVKTRKDSPSIIHQGSSILEAIEGAEKDRVSRAAQTIAYLVKRIKDTGEPKKLLDGVKRFSGAYFKTCKKVYNAVAIVEKRYLHRHINHIHVNLPEEHPEIAVYCLPIAELEQMYQTFYTRMPVDA